MGCVNATSVNNMFKNKIDNYFKRSGMFRCGASCVPTTR